MRLCAPKEVYISDTGKPMNLEQNGIENGVQLDVYFFNLGNRRKGYGKKSD